MPAAFCPLPNTKAMARTTLNRSRNNRLAASAGRQNDAATDSGAVGEHDDPNVFPGETGPGC